MAVEEELSPQRIDPRVYLGILVFRWKLIVLCFVYCLLGGVVYLQLAPKLYRSSAAITIYRPGYTQVTGADDWRQGSTHVQILRSSDYINRVVERLAPRWLPRLGGNPAELRPKYWVETPNAGGLIVLNLRVENSHPAYARAFLRHMVKDFKAARESAKEYVVTTIENILEQEMAQVSDKIRAAEDDVIEYQRVNQMEFVQAKAGLELGYIGGLVKRLFSLETEKWMLEIQSPKLVGRDPEMIQDAYDLTRRLSDPYADRTRSVESGGETGKTSSAEGEMSPESYDPMLKFQFQDKRIRLADLEKQRKSAVVVMKEDNPKLKLMDQEIEAIKQSLAVSSETQISRLKERAQVIELQIESVNEAIRRWKNSYLMASRKQSDYRHVQMSVGRLETVYTKLYDRLHATRLDQEFKAETTTVSVEPWSTTTPVWPDAGKVLLISLLCGIGSGLGVALMAFFFDDKVQSVNDVETTLGVPFLGGIPYWVHSEVTSRIRPIVSEQHRSGASEAYRALRTNVLAAVEKTGKRCVLLTSADSKEGKTLTALNLAIMIAKTGKKTVLLDMDLRRGVLHKSFETERSPGIVDALRERRPLSDVVVGTTHEHLWFAPAGQVEKNTSELLHAADLESVLGELLKTYDYVLMDSAPVLRVTDTVILGGCPLVCVVYVAHANKTTKQVIRYSLDMLGDVHIIGMIVNSIEMHRISSLYYAYQYPNYAYYSYAYKYGYDYDLYDEHGRGKESHAFLGSFRRSARKWWGRTFFGAE